MKLSDVQIAARVSQRRRHEPYHRKIHDLRRLVAGDVSVLGGGGSAAQPSDMEELYKAAAELFDILVTDVSPGRSNKLLSATRTLAFQTTLEFPDYEFEDLSAEENIVNIEWLRNRLNRADAQAEVFAVTMDYLVGGVGAAFTGYRNEYLCVDRIDPLDLVWDLQASTFSKIRWASWTVRQSLAEWLEMFPKNEQLRTMAIGGDDQYDRPIAVDCYYDVEGEDGNLCYFLLDAANSGQVSEDQLIERVKNPYKRDSGGGDMDPCVPLSFMSYFSLPSVKVPLSPVEMMLPAQIALWEADARIRDIVDANRPIWQMQEGSVNPADIEAWKRGDPNLVLRITKGEQGLVVSPTIGIDQSLVDYRNRNEEELVAQSGANPYASGNPVKGVSYAAEVNAIQGQAGLVAAAISKDAARFWQSVGKQAIAAGSLYDDQPFTIRTSDGDTKYEVHFDEMNPVRDLLRPDADLVVSEDTMSFKPKDAKVQQAALNLQMVAPFAQQFPNLLTKALEDLLRAQGVKDIASRLQVPQVDPMSMGAVAGVDPAAMAMASTAA